MVGIRRLKLDSFSSAEESYLFGEEEAGDPTDFRLEPIAGDGGAESRLNVKVDRQSIAQPGLSEVALLLGALGSLVVIAFLIPRPQLESHPRCGLTTGGKVCALYSGSLLKRRQHRSI